MSSRAGRGLTSDTRQQDSRRAEMPAQIVVTEFVSLDGVMEAPGGEPDFKYPGWTFEYDRGDDGNQFKLDETRSADAVAQVRRLKQAFDGELQVPGSHRLVQALLESDLVDQINLMVFPVILGTGKKAFEEQPERRRMRLKESKVVGEGVAVLIYERAA